MFRLSVASGAIVAPWGPSLDISTSFFAKQLKKVTLDLQYMPVLSIATS